MFDIGIVYAKGDRLYLAVTKYMLLTVGADGLEEIIPVSRNGFEERRKKQVRDLVVSWGINSALLDEIADAYMEVERRKARAALRLEDIIFGNDDDESFIDPDALDVFCEDCD